MKRFEYLRPQSLEEVSNILLKYGDEAHILNGGTDLIVRMKDGLTEPKIVVDIKGIDSLDKIAFDKNEGLRIGASVTLNEIASNSFVKSKYKLLGEAAHTVGSMQVRNRATLVGNICNASPLADTATPLLVLDSIVVIHGPDGEREVPIIDFFVGVRRTCLKAGEVVKAVKVPLFDNIVFADYQKLSRRKEVDLSTVCVSIVKVDNEYRIAVGAVAPTPLRLRKTEEFLRDKKINEETIKEAEEIAVSEISPISDIRASKEYRAEMVKVLINRGLIDIKSKLGN